MKSLDDLEMFDLIRAAYPERFTNDDDETWDAVMDFISADLVGFDEIADLLGRVVMLTMPMRSPLTNTLSHCLGSVTIKNDNASMVAAVSRDAATG